MRKLALLSLTLLFVPFVLKAQTATPTQSNVPNPVAMLSQAANSTLAQISAYRTTHKIASSAAMPFPPVAKIIESTLLPIADLEAMSQRTIGPAFTNATPAQQAHFKEAYKTMLINTYGVVLAKYNDQQIQFFKIRGGYESLTQVTVKGRIIFPQNTDAKASPRPPIEILYTLILDAKLHQWRMIDLSVEGISLLESFKAQFTAELNKSKQDGLDHLLAMMDAHNADFLKKLAAQQ